MSIRKAAMNNLITSVHFTLLHSEHFCKAVEGTGQVSALLVILRPPRANTAANSGARREGRKVKGSQQNCTRAAEHFREMKGQRGLGAVAVSFPLFVPWWSSWVSFSLQSNGLNCFLRGFCRCFSPAFEFAVMFTVFNLFLVLLWIMLVPSSPVFFPPSLMRVLVCAQTNNNMHWLMHKAI